jgi:hypothetical protein
VATAIFGACNERLSRPPEDVRFGNRGSVSIDYTKGKWYDFENKRGGGVKDLIKVYKGIDKRDEAIAYAKECLNGGKPSANRDAGNGEARAESKTTNKSYNNKVCEAVYIYCDRGGKVAFEVVRFIHKQADGSDAAGADGKRIKSFAQRQLCVGTQGRRVHARRTGQGLGCFQRS